MTCIFYRNGTLLITVSNNYSLEFYFKKPALRSNWKCFQLVDRICLSRNIPWIQRVLSLCWLFWCCIFFGRNEDWYWLDLFTTFIISSSIMSCSSDWRRGDLASSALGSTRSWTVRTRRQWSNCSRWQRYLVVLKFKRFFFDCLFLYFLSVLNLLSQRWFHTFRLRQFDIFNIFMDIWWFIVNWFFTNWFLSSWRYFPW